jgi:hypothetical protein
MLARRPSRTGRTSTTGETDEPRQTTTDPPLTRGAPRHHVRGGSLQRHGETDDTAQAGANETVTTGTAGDEATPGAENGEDDAGGPEVGSVDTQQGVEDVEVDFVSPGDGDTIEADTVSVEVRLAELRPAPALAGTESRTGTGHWHLFFDGQLVDMVFDTAYELSMVNLEPGEHTLRAVPALNDHTELEGQGDEVTFTWDPDAVPPAVQPAEFDGDPQVDIVAPADGTTVAAGDTFEIQLHIEDFESSQDLLGKPSVDGYGRWHLNVDSADGSLGGLIRMGTEDTITVPTDGLEPGVHTFFVTLTDSGHAPLSNADAQDSVEVAVQ